MERYLFVEMVSTSVINNKRLFGGVFSKGVRMKKIPIVLLVGLFLMGGASSVSAQTISLFDWAFYVDGATYEDVLGDSMPTTGSLTDGLGTLTWTTSDVGDHTIISFFDHEIIEDMNTFFNEFGAENGTPAAGQTWEIDEPGYVFGDIYENTTGWNELDFDYTSPVGLDNTNNVPAGLEDDVSMAMGWDFTLGTDETATIEFILSLSAPASGFYLAHTDPDTIDVATGGIAPTTIYFSSSLDITGGGGPGPQPIPEPGIIFLLGTGLAGIVGLARKKI
jgi:hypothetical protein